MGMIQGGLMRPSPRYRWPDNEHVAGGALQNRTGSPDLDRPLPSFRDFSPFWLIVNQTKQTNPCESPENKALRGFGADVHG